MSNVSMIDGHIDEPRMTNEDIIKALECCVGDERCTECPMFEKCGDDIFSLEEAALDLIKRLKTENKQLRAHIKHTNNVVKQVVEDAVKTTEAKTIKKISDMVINEIISDTAYGCDYNQHGGYYDPSIKIGDITEYVSKVVKDVENISQCRGIKPDEEHN